MYYKKSNTDRTITECKVITIFSIFSQQMTMNSITIFIFSFNLIGAHELHNKSNPFSQKSLGYCFLGIPQI